MKAVSRSISFSKLVIFSKQNEKLFSVKIEYIPFIITSIYLAPVYFA